MCVVDSTVDVVVPNRYEVRVNTHTPLTLLMDDYTGARAPPPAQQQRWRQRRQVIGTRPRWSRGITSAPPPYRAVSGCVCVCAGDDKFAANAMKSICRVGGVGGVWGRVVVPTNSRDEKLNWGIGEFSIDAARMSDVIQPAGVAVRAG